MEHKTAIMRTLLFIIFHLLPLLIFGQFEATLYGSLSNSNSYGVQLEANHVPNDYLAIGIFGGFTKYTYDYYDKNHLFSTGVLVEGRGRFNEKMKIIPIINGSIGYCSEYTNYAYMHGKNNEKTGIVDRHQNGIYMSLRLGLISNFEKISPFDFKIDIGLVKTVIEPLSVLSVGSQQYLQSRLGVIYSF
jgi:hypothetical protein